MERPKRPCGRFGCAGLVEAGEKYCAACRERQGDKETRRQGDKENRPSAAKRGYGHRWRVYRRWFLARHPLCVECRKAGRVTPAEHVDHVRAVTGPDDAGFWDETNHQGLCASCHSRKTATEDGGFGNQ